MKDRIIKISPNASKLASTFTGVRRHEMSGVYILCVDLNCMPGNVVVEFDSPEERDPEHDRVLHEWKSWLKPMYDINDAISDALL